MCSRWQPEGVDPFFGVKPASEWYWYDNLLYLIAQVVVTRITQLNDLFRYGW